MNYFELFKIPISFLPDKQQVKTAFYLLSRQYHPDFHTQNDASAQTDALEMSALVNKAFQTLNNLYKTIPYLLTLKGFLQDDEKPILPQDFLMDMMDLNEAAEECDSEAEKDALTQKIAHLKEAFFKEVEPLLSLKEAELTEAVLLQVKDFYFKTKYLNKILESLK